MTGKELVQALRCCKFGLPCEKCPVVGEKDCFEAELHQYLGAAVGYGWHISDLRVYDHPRDLWEFTGLRQTKFGLAPGPITRPPQSWRYVEEEI